LVKIHFDVLPSAFGIFNRIEVTRLHTGCIMQVLIVDWGKGFRPNVSRPANRPPSPHSVGRTGCFLGLKWVRVGS
jgi:hypothetical protein